MNFSIPALIESYIRSEWINFSRPLIPPQARQEMLCGAALSFYERDSTVPVNSYAEPEQIIAHPHPVIANVNGEFPAIHLPRAVDLKLYNLHGLILAAASGIDTITG